MPMNNPLDAAELLCPGAIVSGGPHPATKPTEWTSMVWGAVWAKRPLTIWPLPGLMGGQGDCGAREWVCWDGRVDRASPIAAQCGTENQ
jgi:hypothetical protein